MCKLLNYTISSRFFWWYSLLPSVEQPFPWYKILQIISTLNIHESQKWWLSGIMDIMWNNRGNPLTSISFHMHFFFQVHKFLCNLHTISMQLWSYILYAYFISSNLNQLKRYIWKKVKLLPFQLFFFFFFFLLKNKNGDRWYIGLTEL